MMQQGKLGSFCPRFLAHEFKPAEFYAAGCGDKFASDFPVSFSI